MKLNCSDFKLFIKMSAEKITFTNKSLTLKQMYRKMYIIPPSCLCLQVSYHFFQLFFFCDQ